MNRPVLLFIALLFCIFSARAEEAPFDYRQAAMHAVDNLLGHFWVGSPGDGHIVPTWSGYPGAHLPDVRGALWERAMLYLTLNDLYLTTHDPILNQRLAAEWRHVKAIYPAAMLQAVGEHSHANWACDDAGWSSMFYWAAYQRTSDEDALNDAKQIVKNAYARWLDDQLGGGMWYADTDHGVQGKVVRRSKSLYQVGIVLTSLRIYEQTHDRAFLDPAMNCYNWTESHLLRDDGLYWCDVSADGPAGKNRPRDIREAGSVSFLGGNMAMGVINATLFRITGDDRYHQRALRTAAAIRTSPEIASDGVLIDDRDAWTNGTFAGDWAREVLALPGITNADRALLKNTARAIATKDVTLDHYYGGCWDGPADGPLSRWSHGGSKPQQIMTSASAANMIVAAAALQ